MQAKLRLTQGGLQDDLAHLCQAQLKVEERWCEFCQEYQVVFLEQCTASPGTVSLLNLESPLPRSSAVNTAPVPSQLEWEDTPVCSGTLCPPANVLLGKLHDSLHADAPKTPLKKLAAQRQAQPSLVCSCLPPVCGCGGAQSIGRLYPRLHRLRRASGGGAAATHAACMLAKPAQPGVLDRNVASLLVVALCCVERSVCIHSHCDCEQQHSCAQHGARCLPAPAGCMPGQEVICVCHVMSICL